MGTQRLQAVLFDVDGTLVDTTYVHAVCWWQAFRQGDRDVPMARIHRAIGMGADRLVAEVLGPVEESEIAELAAAHAAIYSTYWSQLRPLSGARPLLERCQAAGLTTVLASSAARRELDVLLTVVNADAFIDVTTSADDARSSKPAPDIIEAALAKAALPAESAVFVGDSIWDVLSSGRAGLPCIGLECGGTSEAELLEAGAAAVYRDPADLLASFTDSPLSGRGR